MPKQTLARIVYRLLSGRPLDGQARTDATYLRPGTRALTETGRASRWAMLAGWKRQLARLAALLALAAAAVAFRTAPGPTRAVMAALAALGAVRVIRAVRRRWRRRRFVAAYVAPTVAAITAPLGGVDVRLHVSPELGSLTPRLAKPLSPAEQAVRQWYGVHLEPAVRWLPDRTMRTWWAAQRHLQPGVRRLDWFRRPGTESGARIELVAQTPYLTSEQRKLVSSVVGAKIPVADLVETWDQVGARVTGTWTVRRRPPARVGLTDLQAALPGLAEWEYFIGLGTGGRPVVVSLRDDSPHIACSAGSGAGKSVLAQLIAVQVLNRGGRVLILDRKGSHRWARGVPGVEYCTQPAEMHDALIRRAELADQRNTQALTEDDGWDPGQRVFIIAEELNATTGQLRDYWAETRDKGEARISPAIRALREILFMGRSANVHVFGVAQMLSAAAIGGPEARENFGIRCLARYSVNAWKMLVPEAAMPRASRTLGRWQIVVGGVTAECQVAFLTAAQARAFATPVHVHAKDPDGPLTRDVDVDVDMADPLAEPISLREAIDEGILVWTLAATQKRLQRARKAGAVTPTPVGKQHFADLYRRGDLIIWTESERVS